MSTKTAEPARYQVTAALIQLSTRRPVSSGSREASLRHYRRGEILPDWVSAEEIAHLTNLSAIEGIA